MLNLASLSGCSHTPITLTFYEAAGIAKRTNLDNFELNPGLSYLRVTIKDKPLLMVLGYTEVLPQGTLNTWYSNQGEVLQLLNGRVWSTAGLAIDWKNVRFETLPSARYGIALKDGQPVQVYGEQCFSNELCFSWQAWPVVP